ncbi:hypothetical protein [Aequorivita marisscotiae]|uniref:Lipoprotein n=1 Tax=Aequorivita marisscotiae TaxID=3040348 RepID=A0ABY8KPS9_9FLAO|nr:hypothetical protein [Aequorivita sp. Ant34-E75]WGF91471.1 hypothetical protein QCQ61_09635 [Aequorivita sp. Ant34-E75]
MWKYLVILTLLITFSSCGSKKSAVKTSEDSKEIVLGKSETVSYKSLGNGVASIAIHLFENNTFKFNFKSIPQPGTDEKPIRISEKGTYTSDGSWKTLQFKNPKFSLAAIFDAQYAAASDFKVIDKESVKINTSKNALSIWGVVCEKQ